MSHYECPVCGSHDPQAYLRCNRPDCTDGRDSWNRQPSRPTSPPLPSKPVLTDKDKLWAHCVKFIMDNDISCEEAVYQTDRVIENAYDFIPGICEIVGYNKS